MVRCGIVVMVAAFGRDRQPLREVSAVREFPQRSSRIERKVCRRCERVPSPLE